VYPPIVKLDKGGDENTGGDPTPPVENPAVPTLRILHRFINRFPDMFVVFATLRDETLSVSDV
jgi:hypothetical protein